MKKQKEINFFDIYDIVCGYDIKKGKKDKDDYLNQIIINSFEEAKRNYSWIKGKNNEKQIRKNRILYLNDNRINFCFQYNFEKEGKYFIKIFLKQSLTNLNYMFYGCSSLTSLNLYNFITNNVKDMRWMFSHCSSLTSLNLSKFITNNVDNMSGMFSFCSSLTSLNLSNFITNNVINMSGMFRNCSSLTSLNLSNFNTNNVKDMSFMFCYCSALTSLDLSNFDTNNVEDMRYMFSGLNKNCKIKTNDKKILNSFK